MTKSLCPLPFTHASTFPSGQMRVCCNATTLKRKHRLDDKDGNIVDLSTGKISDVWNGRILTRIRQEMIEGKRPDECERCWREEDTGLTSRRISELKRIDAHELDRRVAATAPTGEISLGPIDFDLRFGTLCNLKCLPCGPHDSSKWYDDFKKLVTWDGPLNDENRKILAEVRPADPRHSWFANPAFWDDLRKTIESTDEPLTFYLVGGEPMLIERHFTFLQELVSAGLGDRVNLRYNTNLTVLPDVAVNMFPHFRRVEIHGSLDAFGAANDYARYPAHWDEIEENIRRLESLNDPRIEFNIHQTLTNINVWFWTDLLKWWEERPKTSAIKYRSMYRRHAMSPPGFALYELPPRLKEAARGLMLAARDDLKDPIHRNMVNGTIAFMDSRPFNGEMWTRFCTHTMRVDSLRGNCLFDHIPDTVKDIVMEEFDKWSLGL